MLLLLLLLLCRGRLLLVLVRLLLLLLALLFLLLFALLLFLLVFLRLLRRLVWLLRRDGLHRRRGHRRCFGLPLHARCGKSGPQQGRDDKCAELNGHRLILMVSDGEDIRS